MLVFTGQRQTFMSGRILALYSEILGFLDLLAVVKFL